jgi:Tfp pilus assembly protein PilZ
MGLARQRAIDAIRKKGGTIRTHEAFEEGIHRRTFYGLRDEGVLVTISRGLYQLADMKAPSSTVSDRLIELILSMPEAEQHKLLKDLEGKLLQTRRRHTRKPFFMVVDYATEDRAYKDFIQNISAGGVFIETPMPFSAGQEISLTFPLPNYQKYIKINGEVMWTSAKGIGVSFRLANQDQEATIRSLLDMI